MNGINGRLPVLLRWLKQTAPEIVCLQELKARRRSFLKPRLALPAMAPRPTGRRCYTIHPSSHALSLAARQARA